MRTVGVTAWTIYLKGGEPVLEAMRDAVVATILEGGRCVMDDEEDSTYVGCNGCSVVAGNTTDLKECCDCNATD